MNFISENPVIVIVILIAAGVVVYVSYFTNKAVVKRKLKNAKLKTANEFKSGQSAKIIGRVECTGNVLVAPLSGRECAYYYVLVEKKTSSGKNSYWSTLIEDEAETEFLLKDGDTYVHIEDKKMKSHIVQDRHYTSGFMEDAARELEAYLNKHGHDSENYLGFNKTIRYREAILEVGEAVAVFGQGTWQPSHVLDLPEQYGNVLVINAKEDGYIYLSDDVDTVNVI